MWYIIKHRNDKRWRAYEIDTNTVKVKRGYKIKGPFPSLLKALMAANQGEQRATRGKVK